MIGRLGYRHRVEWRLIDIGDANGNRLGIDSAVAIIDLHRHVIDVIATGIEWGLEVGGSVEGEHTSGAVN
ncbi:MAG: hypothetical protein E2O38_12165, partial [Proteobacteria bacterium]